MRVDLTESDKTNNARFVFIKLITIGKCNLLSLLDYE